ncbi:hypothetical protein L5470_01830 [Synechococcus sp. PCC 6717]|jgi:hypothetical protein|uniref:Uncharacterized protein n=1 Tax=Parathermosynechococcus lividus PCC 6715 TaxID=1917166 RepID=A0A2D2Q0Y0_PARLV|nr:hypothetical protein [Thermostichus lividus]ATS18172.1 hypothetical protein BRW62_04745 [Thermostichus lividus PCC 6715]MCI3279732.1 hypothetical protein [Synechococcus sp. PCC 6717]
MAEPTLRLRTSFLISGTLMGLYGALTLPLPFLAEHTAAPLPLWLLWGAIALGALALWGALSQRVELDPQGIGITYPHWVPAVLRRQWQVPWAEITAVQPRSTSQGGLVYYLVTTSGQAYLLPMRVAGFTKMLRFIEQQTGLPTALIKPLAQPWMYGTLAVFTLLLGAIDLWVLLSMG